MAFIITTKRREPLSSDSEWDVSRRAVATMHPSELGFLSAEAIAAVKHLQNGNSATLADGTVVMVNGLSQRDLCMGAQWPLRWGLKEFPGGLGGLVARFNTRTNLVA